MPGLDLLDVAIGVIFLYLLMSLVCSAAVEFVEVLLQFRARDLEHGIRELLRDPDLVTRVYRHPLVNCLYKGNYAPPASGHWSVLEKWRPSKWKLPSYIPARTFALALLDIAGGGGGTTVPMRLVRPQGSPVAVPERPPDVNLLAILERIGGTEASHALVTLIVAAGNDAVRARENVEEWFNSSMDRVSGWFKRRTQQILLLCGLIAAVALNVDSIGIAKVLATNKAVRDDVVNRAIEVAKTKQAENDKKKAADDAAAKKAQEAKQPPAATDSSATHAAPIQPKNVEKKSANGAAGDVSKSADDAQKELDTRVRTLTSSGLPLGWDNPLLPMPVGPWDWFLKIVGILITACAVSLGAPFWFDTLNKIIVVRSTVKPKEKSGVEGSKEPKP